MMRQRCQVIRSNDRASFGARARDDGGGGDDARARGRRTGTAAVGVDGRRSGRARDAATVALRSATRSDAAPFLTRRHMSADAGARARGAESVDGDSDGGGVVVEVVEVDAGARGEGKSAAAVREATAPRGGGVSVQKNKAHRDGHALYHATLWVVQLIFAVMHVFSNRALAHLTPTVFCAFRLAIGMPFLAVNA
jgi:hypothetical protein